MLNVGMGKKILSLTLFSLFFLIIFSVACRFVFAQTTTSNCVITKIGNPQGQPSLPPECNQSAGGDTGNAISDYAVKLVDAVTNHTDCQQTTMPAPNGFYRYLTGGKNGEAACLEKINAPQLGIQNFDTVKSNYWYSDMNPYFQCVGFANGTLAGANGKVLTGWTSEVNADKYTGMSSPGYQWIPVTHTSADVMKPGDIVIWVGLCCGHIAIATKGGPAVNGAIRFSVAEGNGNGKGSVDIHNYSTVGDNNEGLTVTGWFRKT